MKALRADESLVLDRREIMRALQIPANHTVFESAVRDEIRPVVHAHFDFIDQAFAQALEHNDETIVDIRPETLPERAVVFDGRPRTLAGVVAVSPVRWEAFVPFGINQFK